MKVRRAWYEEVGTRFEPALKIAFDTGDVATITTEVNRQLRRGHGVFLGAEFEDKVPPMENVGPSGLTFYGYTDDAEVVALAERYAADTENDGWQDGKVLVEGP